MFGFGEARAAIEAEGCYIGGWSLKQAIIPATRSNKHDKDNVEATNVLVDWQEAEERALLRKLDLRVLFPCCILYYCAYLDRANMGYVNVLQAGTQDSLEKGLDLHGIVFNWAISITYFATTILLLPSNLLMKKMSGKYFLPMVMAGFGALSACIAASQNAGGILASRFFLGVPEAGVVPAVIMYFSFWYKPSERALRIGLFHASNSLAVGTGGFIANGIDALNGRLGLASWRWVFIIEGCVTIGLAVPVYFLLLTYPESSTALSERERYIAVNRFGRGATRQTDATWDTKTFVQVMMRPSTYVFFISYVCLLIPNIGVTNFLPTILHSLLHYSAHQSNQFSAAVFLVSIPCYAIWSWHGDWTRERMWHYIVPIFMSLPCYIVFTYCGSIQSLGGLRPITLYGLCFLANKISISQPAALTYRSMTLYGASEQAVGGAVTIAGLSIASIIGPQIFPSKDKPWYLPGFAAACALLAISAIGFASLPFWLLAEARWRKRKSGHYMPLRALEDATHARVADAVLENEQYLVAAEAKQNMDGEVTHTENIEVTVQKAGPSNTGRGEPRK